MRGVLPRAILYISNAVLLYQIYAFLTPYLKIADLNESQVYEWLPYTHEEDVPEGAAERFEWLKGMNITEDTTDEEVMAAKRGYAVRNAKTAARFRKELIERYGEEKGSKIRYAEAFEICEYGTQPSEEMKKRIGKTVKVLVENVSRDNQTEMLGRTSRDERVVFKADNSLIGNFVDVKLGDDGFYHVDGSKATDDFVYADMAYINNITGVSLLTALSSKYNAFDFSKDEFGQQIVDENGYYRITYFDENNNMIRYYMSNN